MDIIHNRARLQHLNDRASIDYITLLGSWCSDAILGVSRRYTFDFLVPAGLRLFLSLFKVLVVAGRHLSDLKLVSVFALFHLRLLFMSF